jgi:uncharacterized protein YunC (DUF1805 family)
MIIKEVKFKNEVFMGYELEMFKSPLVIVKAKNGYIMCGYLDIVTADKLGDAAAIVRGVSSIKEILEKEVTEVSAAAKEKKIRRGMTGLQALLRLNKQD